MNASVLSKSHLLLIKKSFYGVNLIAIQLSVNSLIFQMLFLGKTVKFEVLVNFLLKNHDRLLSQTNLKYVMKEYFVWKTEALLFFEM